MEERYTFRKEEGIFFDNFTDKKLTTEQVLFLLNSLERGPMFKNEDDSIDFVARCRFMAWIAYQIAAEQPYNEIPTVDQFDSLCNGVKFAFQHPNMTAEENHINWMNKKIEQGWKYGPIKDPVKKTHPDLVPYSALPPIEQRKDSMDKIINRMARQLYTRIVYGDWHDGY